MSQSHLSYATERAELLFGCYRKGDANDPDAYVGAVAAVLSEYPAETIKFVTDPRTGIPSRVDWMPTVGEIKRACEEHYGPVPARAVRRRDRAAPPTQAHEPRLVTREPQAREALLVRAWMAPSLTTPRAEFGLPLEVLAHLLGGGQGSRLHAALVETGLAVSAGASYDSEAYGVTEFMVYAVPRRGVTPERLEEAATAAIATLLHDGPSEAEVARSIRQLSAGALMALDSFGAAPRMLGGVLAIGLPADVVEYWPSRIRAVTRDQVMAAGRGVLGATGTNTSAWLLPEGA